MSQFGAEKFTTRSREAIETAQRLATTSGHSHTEPVHLLVALLGQFVHWREQVDKVTPSELLRRVLAESGYEDMLQKDRSAESAGPAARPSSSPPPPPP